MHLCHDVRACQDLMNQGFNNRHVGATLMNKVIDYILPQLEKNTF